MEHPNWHRMYFVLHLTPESKSLLVDSKSPSVSTVGKYLLENRGMKWPRCLREISLVIQVGITSQINKWANMDPRKYWWWDQVSRRSKHPLLI
jgi:hypothetical protein